MNLRITCAAALAALTLSLGPSLQAQSPTPTPTYSDSKAPVEARVDDLLKRLTLPEKLDLLSLNGDLATRPIARLNIPAFRMADAPEGVRNGQSTVFPLGITMASSWNPPLIRRVGVALGEECRGKGIQVLFGPCVNIHRTPMGGRNGESFSEDPFLATQMTVAYVQGIQSQNVAASVKHFAGNNQEHDRHSINVVMDERTLHEMELPAFEAATRQAHAWSYMAAFNHLNGPWVTDSYDLLTRQLRQQWKFDGFVVSDWGAIHDTPDAAKAGTDLELPKPEFFTAARLQESLDKKQITPAVIDGMVRNLARIMVRTHLLDGPMKPNAALVNSPAHQKLALEVARQGIVLLKNDRAVLPWDRRKIKSIAVIGPNAGVDQMGGRWSADVSPFYSVSPLDGIKKKAGKTITVNYADGNPGPVPTLTPIPATALRPNAAKAGETGLRGEYFAKPDFAGKPKMTRLDPQVYFDWGQKSPDASLPNDYFSARWTGTLLAPQSGRYLLALDSDDGGRLYLGNRLVVDNSSSHNVGSPKWTTMDLVAGKSYPLRVEYNEDVLGAGITLSWATPDAKPDPFHEAVAAAAKSDVAVVVVGLNKDLEGEELDPPSLDLPKNQEALIQAVAAANKKTIVVMNNGTPFLMSSWLDRVPGVIEAWYGGQEAGNAIADVLFGDINPSGKLPDTLAVRRQDYSDWLNYPGRDGTVKYAEGIYMGYRHFDKAKITPLFPFGYGLSYTTFEYRNLQVPALLKRGGTAQISVLVQNTGKRAGTEIVQLYVHDLHPKVDRPLKELKGFQRVSLAPGQKAVVAIPLDEKAFAYYDVGLKKWKSNSGRYEIQVGSSSLDIRGKGILTLQ